MKQKKNVRQMRRRLMTGIFCISLFAADLTSAVPAWAKEPAVEAEQAQEAVGEGEADGAKDGMETESEKDSGSAGQKPAGGDDGLPENSDEKKDTDYVPAPDGEEDSDQTQIPDGENTGDEGQSSGEESDGGETQAPDTGNTQAPDEESAEDGQGPDEEDGVTEDTAGEPELSEEEEVSESASENDLDVQQPSVSENDPEVHTLAVPADAIASGKYENITWVIDANGKLTVEGTGDFTDGSDYKRAPWYDGFASKIKTAEVRVTGMTDASYMFHWCSNLTSVSFAGSDTSTVRNMSNMFSRCSKLETIDFGQSFKTGNVTDMQSMFSECYALGDLDLSSWDTAKVTDMSGMFRNCGFYQFKRIKLGGSFTTRKVEDMEYLFACSWNCENANRTGLQWLDLSWLDLSSATNMYGMFANCDVKQLDFGRLNTDGTTSLRGMFAACDLTGVDFSRLRTDSVTDMSRMFANCKGVGNLRTLNTEHVTDMTQMFATIYVIDQYYAEGVGDITSIDLSGLNAENVIKMGEMFSNQDKLTSVNLSGMDIGNVILMNDMFYGCSKLASVDLRDVHTDRVWDMSSMFYGCQSLTSVDLSDLDTDNVEDMISMFSGCSSLKELKLGSLGKKMTDINVYGNTYYASAAAMFYGCSSLESLDLSNFDYSKVSLSARCELFNECNKLTTIYTPYNLGKDIPLPTGDWYMSDGTKLADNVLPKGLSYSVLIQKDSAPSVSETRMEVSKKKTVYGCGETIDTDDLTVMYYGADGSVRKLTEGEYITNLESLTTETSGTQELVVTCTKDGKTLTKTITLTVRHILTFDNTEITLPAESVYDYTYDGRAKRPVPTEVSYTVKAADDSETSVKLAEGTDYTVSYRNNVNAYGFLSDVIDVNLMPTVIIRGVGQYSGTVTEWFDIHKAAAPDAETKNVMAFLCTQAMTNRTTDLTDCFKAYGKKTDYEIISVEDTAGIFQKTPETADIVDGILTYSTKAVQDGDTADIKLKVSFVNYEDADLTVKITMMAKKEAVISGIVMPDSVVYSGVPVSYSGEASVRTADGTDITKQVSLVYQYSGTMADGKAYTATEAPVNAGSYKLTVSVKEDNPEYGGSREYPFTITERDAVVQADDLTVAMQTPEGGAGASVPMEQYRASFGYHVTGLLQGDTLKKEPTYTVTEDAAGKKTVTAIDTSKTGIYYIHPSGADAGMNYELAYKAGILTVSEERVAYTVTFDGMGHCDGFAKNGVKSGALLEISEDERQPAAAEKGYVFAGWYKDKTFAQGEKWNFDTDTVQSDLTLYACWLNAAAESGLKLCVQEIPDLTYTGSAQKPAVTVYDSDGETLLKSGRDYTVKYVNNTTAAAVGADGKPTVTGGIAKVENAGKANEKITNVFGQFDKKYPYVAITGKGNYSETIYRNFRILPQTIAGERGEARNASGTAENVTATPLAAGFTMKYTDQFTVNGKKEQKPFSSMKYKKAMKAGTDYVVSLRADEAVDGAGNTVPAEWRAAGTVNAGKQYILPAIPKGYSGTFILTVTGQGNYTGAVSRKVYVAEKQKLMKYASVVLGKNQRTHAYTGKDVTLTAGYYDPDTRKNYKVTAEGVVSSTPEENANDMFLVKAGKEGLVWGRDFTIDYAGTNRAAGTVTMTLTGQNGYVGTKSVTFKITGTAFYANTIEVKTYDADHPDEKDWKAVMPYTGSAVTQNKVTLKTKVTKNNPTAQELTYGEHYTISYKNNVKKGTATMTFTVKPASGYTGSFKKTFKITAQELSRDRFTIQTQDEAKTVPEAVYLKNGAKLSFTIKNEAGTVLREGTDYTVKYKNNNAVTTAQTAENKKPLMTITGKGSYKGKVEVPFTIVPASIASALDEQIIHVSCAQVMKKDSMQFKEFKLKLMEGKKTLGAGETKDYMVDATNCTPEKLKAYAEALAAGTATPENGPSVTVKGRGCYTGEKIIPLGQYMYLDKLTAACVYVVVSEGAGQNIYTGRQVTPDVAVYYGGKTAVGMAKRDKVTDEVVLTEESGGYKLKKLIAGSDYSLVYGANVASGKNKGSVIVSGAGRYGGSVTVKFGIEKKSIY